MPKDKAAIKAALVVAYNNWVEGKVEPIQASNTVIYQRDEQARMLAELIK